MMARYFKFNGSQVHQSNDFSLEKESLYAGQYTTCTGDICADYIGWKYSDATLTWGTLPTAEFDVLQSLSGQVDFSFIDSTGTEVTEKCMVKSRAYTPTRHTRNGSKLCTNVTMGVSFLEHH